MYGDTTAYTGKLHSRLRTTIDSRVLYYLWHDLRGKHRITPKASTLIANVIELSS